MIAFLCWTQCRLLGWCVSLQFFALHSPHSWDHVQSVYLLTIWSNRYTADNSKSLSCNKARLVGAGRCTGCVATRLTNSRCNFIQNFSVNKKYQGTKTCGLYATSYSTLYTLLLSFLIVLSDNSTLLLTFCDTVICYQGNKKLISLVFGKDLTLLILWEVRQLFFSRTYLTSHPAPSQSSSWQTVLSQRLKKAMEEMPLTTSFNCIAFVD